MPGGTGVTVKIAGLPEQTVAPATTGAAGVGLIITSNCARGPSQPFTVWLTKYEVVPDPIVLGVGVGIDGVLMSVEYQFNVPVALGVAVNAKAVAPWQYVMFATVGAVGNGVIVIA